MTEKKPSAWTFRIVVVVFFSPMALMFIASAMDWPTVGCISAVVFVAMIFLAMFLNIGD